MNYPEHCIKGVPNQEALQAGGDGPVATSILFQFNSSHDNNRTDEMLEESINPGFPR